MALILLLWFFFQVIGVLATLGGRERRRWFRVVMATLALTCDKGVGVFPELENGPDNPYPENPQHFRIEIVLPNIGGRLLRNEIFVIQELR